MAVTLGFFNYVLDFSWVGERMLNPDFDANYSLTPTDDGFNPLKYYRYLPKNLDFRSDERYRNSFLPDVNWDDRNIHPDDDDPE